jgi:hypothetical protein
VSLKDRDNPLFFKRDGGMDLSQFILLCIVGWITLVFTLAGFQVLTYSNAAWAFLGSFTSLAFIAWAARDRAALIANSKTPGEVAAGIAKAAPPYPEMDQRERTDDD